MGHVGGGGGSGGTGVDRDTGGEGGAPRAPMPQVPPPPPPVAPAAAAAATSCPQQRVPFWSFWSLGLFNNASFVLMLAAAKSISEGGTALVYLASIVPGLTVKLTAPYWFDRVSYRVRLGCASMLMAGCFTAVGVFQGRLGWELVGVGLCSLQGSLGEASLLALAGRFDSDAESVAGGAEAAGGAAVGAGDNCAADDGAAEMGEGEYHRAESDDACDADLASADAVGRGCGKARGKIGKGKGGKCITAFSSGTGLAGVFGFFYKVLLTNWIGISLRTSLFLANAFAVLYWYTYWSHLDAHVAATCRSSSAQSEVAETSSVNSGSYQQPLPPQQDTGESIRGVEMQEQGKRRQKRRRRRRGYDGLQTSDGELELTGSHNNDDGDAWEDEFSDADGSSGGDDDGDGVAALDIRTLTPRHRLRLTVSLWPYMIPLFTVYLAEYALQSGTWTAIGIPDVTDPANRDKFYEYGNWCYQAGVFVSRSSGTVYQASMTVLWVMPALQAVNLGLFSWVAATHVWYDYTLLIPCFYVGLLGGAVYVNGYTRINSDLPKSLREFALSTVSVADTLGIVVADVAGLFIQSCLYSTNGIDGAVVGCPL